MADTTVRVLRWPLGAATLVRLGTAMIRDLDVPAQVKDRSGTDLDAWLAGLDEASRNAFVVNLSQLLVALDQEDTSPAGVTTWPAPSTQGRRASALQLLGLPPDL